MLKPCRLAPLKKVNFCPDGYRKFRDDLVAGKDVNDIKCQACLQGMKEYKFSLERMNEFIEAKLAGDEQPSAIDAPAQDNSEVVEPVRASDF